MKTIFAPREDFKMIIEIKNSYVNYSFFSSVVFFDLQAKQEVVILFEQ
jgi:hypothetical protein